MIVAFDPLCASELFASSWRHGFVPNRLLTSVHLFLLLLSITAFLWRGDIEVFCGKWRK